MKNDAGADFALHPQLAADTVALGDLALCRALLMNDATWPWIILVPRRAGAVEIPDLSATDAALLMDEIRAASLALRAAGACDKINIGAIGNMVPQLHVHVLARRRDDPLWPQPVWGRRAAVPYAPDARDAMLTRLRDALALPASFQR